MFCDSNPGSPDSTYSVQSSGIAASDCTKAYREKKAELKKELKEGRGTTDTLKLNFIKTDPNDKAYREGNPNAGWLRTAATSASVLSTFAKEILSWGSIAVGNDVDLGLKIAGAVIACGNMAFSSKRNLPVAYDGKSVLSMHPSKPPRVIPNSNKFGSTLEEERDCRQNCSTASTLRNLALVAPAVVAGFYLGGPSGSVAGATLATKVVAACGNVTLANVVAHAREVYINVRQKRPYVDFSSWWCCAKANETAPLIPTPGTGSVNGDGQRGAKVYDSIPELPPESPSP